MIWGGRDGDEEEDADHEGSGGGGGGAGGGCSMSMAEKAASEGPAEAAGEGGVKRGPMEGRRAMT